MKGFDNSPLFVLQLIKLYLVLLYEGCDGGRGLQLGQQPRLQLVELVQAHTLLELWMDQ